MATKIMMGFGIILAGIFMYFFAKELFGKIGGIVAALFYIYVPYHAIDIYVRGDVSEFWAYAFIPLVFYGLWKIYKNKSWFFVIVSSIGYAGIILSHNLTAMMVTPFLLLYILFLVSSFIQKKTKEDDYLFTFRHNFRSYNFLFLLVTCVNGNEEYQCIIAISVGGQIFLITLFVLPQLWSSPWGYGGSAPGCVDGLIFYDWKTAYSSFHCFYCWRVSLLVIACLKNINRKRKKF
jgi:hypothetical protein